MAVMSKAFLALVALLPVTIAGCVTTGGGAAWQCSAQGLLDSSYHGGNTANIHLQGYPQGGDYWVKLNDQQTEATGTTANGTPFTCTKMK